MTRHTTALLALTLMAAACGGSGGNGNGATPTPTPGSGAPALVYDGPPGGTIPGWNPAAPVPLVLYGTQNAGNAYFTSAHVESNGAIDGIVVDHVTAWAWSGGGPSLLYHGPLAGAVVPGWNAASPRPLLCYSRQNGVAGGTAVASGLIHADGTMGNIVADEIWIWGWNSGAPGLRFQGVLGSALIPSWTPATPFPVLFGVRYQGDWYDPPLAAQVLPNGALTNLVTDQVLIWGF